MRSNDAGRFDYLLCMGPPTLQAKCDAINVFFEEDSSTESVQVGKLILECASKDQWLEDQLGLYTFGEFVSVITQFGPVRSLSRHKLSLPAYDKFAEEVRNDSLNVSLKRDETSDGLKKIKRWKQQKLSDLDSDQYTEQRIKAKGIDVTIPAYIKHILDRKQTRRQFAKSSVKSFNTANNVSSIRGSAVLQVTRYWE